jgi:hypothetical protein
MARLATNTVAAEIGLEGATVITALDLKNLVICLARG